MRIAVDIDDVLADFVTNLAIFHNHHYGTQLKREDFKSFFYHDTWGGNQIDAVHKTTRFYESPFYEKIKPIVGAVEGINKLLADHHELIIITSRPSDFKDRSIAWIEEHFPKKFSDFYFTNAFSLTKQKKKRKVEICLEVGAKLLIDDSQIYVEECHEFNVPSILFDAPWNQSFKIPSTSKRAKNWKDVISVVSR